MYLFWMIIIFEFDVTIQSHAFRIILAGFARFIIWLVLG
jgi:hypothetical protein